LCDKSALGGKFIIIHLGDIRDFEEAENLVVLPSAAKRRLDDKWDCDDITSDNLTEPYLSP
jgi:hypothetical protein